MTVDFAKRDDTPVAVDDGVVIASDWSAQHGAMRRWSLRGAFRLSEKEAARIGAAPLQRALCVTITAGFRNETFNLIGEQLTFPDDEERSMGSVRGYFNADLLPRFALDAYQRCFVLVSLGPHVSNVLEVQAADADGSAA